MANTRTPKIPEEYQPITMWGYFGYEILFNIPIIGWIFVIIFALTADNINLRNFARSWFCVMILQIIFFLVMFITGLFSAMLTAMFN